MFVPHAVIYDVFAARFPACPVSVLNAAGMCDASTAPPGCCDVAGGIRPTRRATDAAAFFVFLPMLGVVIAVINAVVGGSRFFYAFARVRCSAIVLHFVLTCFSGRRVSVRDHAHPHAPQRAHIRAHQLRGRKCVPPRILGGKNESEHRSLSPPALKDS